MMSTRQLAERGVSYKREKLWVREIRKLNESKHQTTLITTDFMNEAKVVAGKMFARWSQENFLKYMMEHFGIDRLIEYKQEEIDETATVVNPQYKELESTIRTKAALLSRQRVHSHFLVNVHYVP